MWVWLSIFRYLTVETALSLTPSPGVPHLSKLIRRPGFTLLWQSGGDSNQAGLLLHVDPTPAPARKYDNEPRPSSLLSLLFQAIPDLLERPPYTPQRHQLCNELVHPLFVCARACVVTGLPDNPQMSLSHAWPSSWAFEVWCGSQPILARLLSFFQCSALASSLSSNSSRVLMPRQERDWGFNTRLRDSEMIFCVLFPIFFWNSHFYYSLD